MKTTHPSTIMDNLPPLTRHDLREDPIRQFGVWYEQALAQEPHDPAAMTLSTVDKDYHVTARMLLLKGFSEEGFIFYTHYNSPKARDLEANPQAALTFWWPTSQRQVRITGTVVKTSPEQSAEYFASRPIGSQIAAMISKQSEVIPDRSVLVDAYEKARHQPVSCPPSWGGYILCPDSMEFFQGRPHRLHDRFEYRKQATGWVISQLSP